MPDTNGLLTAQDNEKIQSWWRLNWRDPVVCPVCKTSDWGLGSHVVNVHRYALDASAPSQATYPHILVACKRCSHTMFFNAVSIGIVGAFGQAVPPPDPPPTRPTGLFSDIPLPPPPIFPPFKSG